ncbi:type II and III secretion system protein family protein [Pseudomonas fakonensis]|uniref:Type II and III secretion system protein family protein n=1 Tax=Pseudomonas fakonensis TaxID=2842355 RepID=A0ABX8NCJ1_9PSED|nr:type II and III secretion system protein family protein [Pseudomonas fakonensis]QXH53535.1 type II and III secretion system protein family protein [Pseudomonas fakonensis]
MKFAPATLAPSLALALGCALLAQGVQAETTQAAAQENPADNFETWGDPSIYANLPATAADPEPEAEPAPRPLPRKLTQVQPSETVNLTVKQGRLLQLPALAANVLVADPTIASFQMPSPGNVFVYAKGAGRTTLYALDANDQVISAINLETHYDLDALTRQIAEEVPGVNVNFGPASGNGLIVRGNVRTPQQAKLVIDAVKAYVGGEDDSTGGGGAGGGGGGGGGGAPGGGGDSPRIVNQLKVELSSQVNISVRIVEVSRSMTTSLGLNWDVALKDGNFFFRNGSSLFDATTGAFTGGTVTNAVAGGVRTRGSMTVGGLLTALSEDGLATVLAEPNLTAMSGETAGFAAGGEVPIVIMNNNQVTIDYKQYGVIMRMTPTLLSPNRISLHVAPEVSDLSEEGAVDLQGFTIPAFKVRRADTTVELSSGQSFALAGMLRSNVAQTVTGVPGLKSLPGIGRLFETDTSKQEDTELVIIATAYVVEPTAPGDLQTPGRGVRSLDAVLPLQATAGYLF